MAFTTLIGVDDLESCLDRDDWAVMDCRFALSDPAKGERDYLKGHIPGAIYANLDSDLSAPHQPGVTGRHPLPGIAEFTETVSGWGIDEKTQVVAYDDMGGAFAARLWWMLQWAGHDAVAVLDGGWQAWLAAGHATEPGHQARTRKRFSANPRPHMLVGAETVETHRESASWCLLDARGADRYRGENETIDPVAGHIPGAANVPFAGNLKDGRFLPADVLRSRYEAALGEVPSEKCIAYCGSGVTAAHNILAMKHAGLDPAKLYAGSWSEWITDPDRPCATEDA